MEENDTDTIIGETSIFIKPGYQFKICQGLITNFHQPASTLMLLVAAFSGNDWRKIYDEALKNDYRFLSYGDSSLLLPEPDKIHPVSTK
jgi:S-adenosylmethionine:tRNA ribosyltransferase-isomerase